MLVRVVLSLGQIDFPRRLSHSPSAADVPHCGGRFFFFTRPMLLLIFFFCFYSLVFCSPCGKAKGKSHFLRSIFSFSIFNCIMQWNHWATKGGRGAKVNFICECGQDASEIGVLGSATSIGSHCSAVKSSNLAFNWFSGGGVKCTVMRLAFPKHFRSLHCLNADQGFVASIWGKALEIG